MVQKALPKRGEPPFIDRRTNALSNRRRRLPWPEERPFRILSLDGGGIRGIYTATLLAEIERNLISGRSVADYFDMIAGTSTGGIIGIGLSLKKSAKSIQDLYLENGKKIFPPFWMNYPILRWGKQLFCSLLDHRQLEKILYQTFKNQTIGEAQTRLIIPAFLGPKSQIAVLKTDHHPDFEHDHKMMAWEAARATSAAPTFFSGHVGDGYVFLDGGVWANNPIMVAIVDAISAYEISLSQIEILSIGTGNPPYEMGKFADRGGFFSWREIIKGAIFLTTDNAYSQACLLIGPDQILRLEPTGPDAQIDLADWPSSAKRLPTIAKDHFRHHAQSLSAFFKNTVPPRERFYTIDTRKV